jgi:hypothetical protein
VSTLDHILKICGGMSVVALESLDAAAFSPLSGRFSVRVRRPLATTSDCHFMRIQLTVYLRDISPNEEVRQ